MSNRRHVPSDLLSDRTCLRFQNTPESRNAHISRGFAPCDNQLCISRQTVSTWLEKMILMNIAGGCYWEVVYECWVYGGTGLRVDVRIGELVYWVLPVCGNMSTIISLYVGTCLQEICLYVGICLQDFTRLRELVYRNLPVCRNMSTGNCPSAQTALRGLCPFGGTCLRLFACMEEHVHCYSIRLSEHVYRWLPVWGNLYANILVVVEL